jgi:hypothetical protein
MASTLIPAAPADGSAPPTSAYHPAAVNPDNCQALRYSADTKDRRWSPMVYAAFQCKKKPVSGSNLCERCLKHKQAYDAAIAAGAPVAAQRDADWSGYVGDLASIPSYSHIAGSMWYLEGKPTWNGAEKPRTAKQEGRLDKRPLVKDVELEHFADGHIQLDIERLCALNQITGAQLLAVICRMEGRVIKAAGSRVEMCARIRRLIAKRSAAPQEAGDEAPALEVTEAPKAKAKAKKAGRTELRARIAELEARLAAVEAERDAATQKLAAVAAVL